MDDMTEESLEDVLCEIHRHGHLLEDAVLQRLPSCNGFHGDRWCSFRSPELESFG